MLRPFPTPIQNLCVTVIFQGPNSQSSQRAWWAASPSPEVPVLLLATSLTGRIKERSRWYNKPFCFPLQGYAFALHLDSHWFRNWWPSDASKCQVSDYSAEVFPPPPCPLPLSIPPATLDSASLSHSAPSPLFLIRHWQSRGDAVARKLFAHYSQQALPLSGA